MRFSEAWLREWVNPPVTTAALADQLSMAGLEVDAAEPVAPAFHGVVVGHVEAVEPHPDAAKLRLCRVDVGQGDGEPLAIICGAANVAAGMRVPVATIGAELPGGFKIKKAKLRGVHSYGMICSAAELGLAESSDGILPLPGDAPVGEDFRAWLGLDDSAIELDLTPDRADCLSVAGVAREVGVLNRVPVTGPAMEPVAPVHDDEHAVELIAGEACPRYLCRVVRGVDPTAETPLWMAERLRRSGLRPIAAVVDVTNYVLLELGQPMHAFDRERLDGPIRVRMAVAGEPLALLNGEEVELRGDTLVIADATRPVAMAGIMGGADSAVTGETRDVLLESAFFTPTAISGRARGYGLHTDSSHRFERGVDSDLQRRAMERATALLLAIAGGEPGPITEAVAESHLPAPEPLTLRRARIGQVLGIQTEDGQVEDILTRLGMTLAPADGGWRVSAPTSRFDIQREVDLIAEIGRIHGYDNIPITHARSAALTRAPAEMAFDLGRSRQVLVDRGYHEAITYSFVSPQIQALFDPDGEMLALANPLSAELSAMRTGLWPGLAQAARQNLSRQQSRVRLFESGLRFREHGGELHQEAMLAGLVVGPVLPEQWGEATRAADFFDLKADVEALLRASGDDCDFVAALHPALHPGQSARIERAGEPVGWIGTLHPAVARELDLPVGTQLFELAADVLGQAPKPSFASLSKFPSIRRDLAILVDAGVRWEQVRNAARAAAGDLLKHLVLFDVYQGQNIEPGRKSMALGLILQASSQTLTDQDVESLVARVVARLTDDLGARLRD